MKSYNPPIIHAEREHQGASDSLNGDWTRYQGDLSSLDIIKLVQVEKIYVCQEGKATKIICPWKDEHTTGDYAYVFDNGDGKFPGFS